MPDALIIPGLPRCATTALVNVLGQHPELQVGVQKEPHYFIPEYLKQRLYTFESSGKRVPFSGLGFCTDVSSYRDNFPAGDGGTWIDASTLYSAFPESVSEIAKHGFGQVRFIVMFRQSLNRAWSHYNFSCSRGEEYREFTDALSQEDDTQDWLLKGYQSAGRIAPVCEAITRIFGSEALYLIDVDSTDILERDVLQDISSFAGLSDFEYSTDVYGNGSEQMKYGWLQTLRIWLRRIRQMNPAIFDNRITRWLFERFMSVAPKGDKQQMPELPDNVKNTFLEIDAENQQVYRAWKQQRSQHQARIA